MTNLELEQFITEYGREIYSFCVSLCGSRQEADDLYQDTFLTALEKIDRIDIAGNIRSYRLWLSVCGKTVGENGHGEGGLRRSRN